MSKPQEVLGSRYGRRRFGPVQRTTFYSRNYRAIHHLTVLVGTAAFFAPFVYRYINRPPVEELVIPQGQVAPNYKTLQAELDKWR